MVTERTVVGIARGEDVGKVLKEAVELSGGLDKIMGEGATVLVKPAMGYSPRMGQNPDDVFTSQEIVSGLVSMAVDNGAGRVIVGEGSAHDLKTRWLFETTGMADAVREAGGEISCFDEEPRVEMDVPGGHLLRRVRVPEIINEADVIINVPKMYVHTFGGGATLGFKNLLGVHATEDRWSWHRFPEMWYYMVDLARLVKPALTVVDGIQGREGPIRRPGNPVPMGVIVAGRDPVATEEVTAALMGFGPKEIPVISIAEHAGLGIADRNRIEVRGVPIADAMHHFTRVVPNLVSSHPNVVVYPGGACLGCQVLMTSFPPAEAIDAGKKYAVVTGVNPRLPDKLEVDEAWVVGNCALPVMERIKRQVDSVRVIEGCPPHRWHVRHVLKQSFTNYTGIPEEAWEEPPEKWPPDGW